MFMQCYLMNKINANFLENITPIHCSHPNFYLYLLKSNFYFYKWWPLSRTKRPFLLLFSPMWL